MCTFVHFYVITDDFGGKIEKKLKKSGKKMVKENAKMDKNSPKRSKIVQK